MFAKCFHYICFDQETNEMEFGDIFTSVSQALGISLTEMAEELGVHRTKLYNLKGGRWNPNYDFCRKLLEAYPQVNAEFLMTGKGDILKKSLVEMIQQLERQAKPL